MPSFLSTPPLTLLVVHSRRWQRRTVLQTPDFPSAERAAIKTDAVCDTLIKDVKAQNAGTL